jgi:hypothetical protein
MLIKEEPEKAAEPEKEAHEPEAVAPEVKKKKSPPKAKSQK